MPEPARDTRWLLAGRRRVLTSCLVVMLIIELSFLFTSARASAYLLTPLFVLAVVWSRRMYVIDANADGLAVRMTSLNQPRRVPWSEIRRAEAVGTDDTNGSRHLRIVFRDGTHLDHEEVRARAGGEGATMLEEIVRSVAAHVAETGHG